MAATINSVKSYIPQGIKKRVILSPTWCGQIRSYQEYSVQAHTIKKLRKTLWNMHRKSIYKYCNLFETKIQRHLQFI
jgi:hypothetical protein